MENTKTVVVQRLQKSLDDEYIIAEKYYSILSALNDLQLTRREIELIAYTAVRGTISYANTRAEFCKKYETTTATINNIVSKLKKVGIFVKEAGKIRVNPVIVVDFRKDLSLVVKLIHDGKNSEETNNQGEADKEAL
jgi:hypothetical protein|tara:strand:+ start:1382 stop:1792 length:411 start_codon:yes stop_codon:yes gene_type:complete